MTDYQAIVEKIRTTLCSESEPDTAALAELARNYAAALQEVNERLNRAEQVLHKGHRLESLQMCDAEPRLLDVVASLDFAEREQWAEYVKQFGLPAPPELSIEVAGDLNEAYAAAEPLAKLLRMHRRFALSRTALVNRLDLLRKIAGAEKGNLLWEEDLKNYETARHEELRSEAGLAMRRNDVRVLAELESELRSTVWRARPPASLVKQVAQAHADLRRKEARDQLPEIAHALTAAYSSLDAQQARERRSRWEGLVAIAELPSGAPEFELAGPALDWLAEEDRAQAMQARFELDLAALERALDGEQPRLELERLHRAATQNGQALPGMLENQYAERLRYLAAREVQRFRLTVIAAVLGVVMISVVTAFMIYSHTQSRKLQDHVVAIQGAYDGDNVEAAQTLLEDLKRNNPAFFGEPQIQELAVKVADKRRDEDERKELFSGRMQDAERLGADQATWQKISEALTVVEQARSIAKGDEIRQVDSLKRKVKTKQTQMQEGSDSWFLGELEPLKTRFEQLGQQWSEAHKQLREDIHRLRVTLREPPVQLQLLKQADLLLDRLDGKDTEHVRQTTEEVFLKKVTEAVPHADPFVAALTDYRNQKDFGTTPRAGDFERVADKESPRWKGIEEWNRFLREWSKLDFEKLDAAQARKLLVDGKRLHEEFVDHPAGADLEEATKFLTALKQRSDKELIPKLIKRLDAIDSLYMVWTDAEVRYYGRAPPDRKEGKWEFRYYRDRKMNEKEMGLKAFSEKQIKNRNSGGKFEWLSPQSAFSRSAVEKLQALQAGKAGWEETFAKLIDELWDDRFMDPAVKVALLYDVMTTAISASQPLTYAYQAIRDGFDTGGLLADLDLIAPDEEKPKEKDQGRDFRKRARKLRKDCEKELSRRERPQHVVEEASKLAAAIKKSLSRPGYDWIAWLRKDQTGEWICQAPRRPDEGAAGELFILFVSADGKELRFDKIGELKNRQLTIDAALKFDRVEGRPVFLHKSIQKR